MNSRFKKYIIIPKSVSLKLLRSALFVFFTFLSTSLFAQIVSGEWYGVGHTKKNGLYNSYLSEMVLKRKGTKVTGVFKYFFRKDSIKVKVHGTYDAKLKRLELLASPILNFQAKNTNGADCPMEGGFNLQVTKTKTTLTGQFNPIFKYRIVCPAIDIQFVKYVPSEEPEDEEDEITDSADQKLSEGNIVQQKQPVKDTVVKKVTQAPIVKKDTSRPANIIRDSIKSALPGNVRSKAPIVAAKPIDLNEKVIKELQTRTFAPVSPVIEVDSDSLKVSFYDNGDIDNDTISVFYNRIPVIVKKMLSNQPLSVTFALDTTINEISMFAENLGLFPPNSAVAIIYAGEQRFELNMTSSFSTNSTIRFRRKPKNNDPKNKN